LFRELRSVIFARKNVGDNIRSLDCNPPRSTASTSAKIDANQTNGVARELYTTKRTNRRKTSRGLRDYCVAAIATENMTAWNRVGQAMRAVLFSAHIAETARIKS
jgi:hypothetical protein